MLVQKFSDLRNTVCLPEIGLLRWNTGPLSSPTASKRLIHKNVQDPSNRELSHKILSEDNYSLERVLGFLWRVRDAEML